MAFSISVTFENIKKSLSDLNVAFENLGKNVNSTQETTINTNKQINESGKKRITIPVKKDIDGENLLSGVKNEFTKLSKLIPVALIAGITAMMIFIKKQVPTMALAKGLQLPFKDIKAWQLTMEGLGVSADQTTGVLDKLDDALVRLKAARGLGVYERFFNDLILYSKVPLNTFRNTKNAGELLKVILESIAKVSDIGQRKILFRELGLNIILATIPMKRINALFGKMAILINTNANSMSIFIEKFAILKATVEGFLLQQVEPLTKAFERLSPVLSNIAIIVESIVNIISNLMDKLGIFKLIGWILKKSALGYKEIAGWIDVENYNIAKPKPRLGAYTNNFMNKDIAGTIPAPVPTTNNIDNSITINGNVGTDEIVNTIKNHRQILDGMLNGSGGY